MKNKININERPKRRRQSLEIYSLAVTLVVVVSSVSRGLELHPRFDYPSVFQFRYSLDIILKMLGGNCEFNKINNSTNKKSFLLMQCDMIE